VLFDHLNEGGSGLKPFCDLLPGGKYGNLFQDMQNLYYYMLMLSNGNTIDDRIVSIIGTLCLRKCCVCVCVVLIFRPATMMALREIARNKKNDVGCALILRN
jgi:hypothetical protein